MKKILLPLLLLISIGSYAQTGIVSNFTMENGSLIYRQVFEIPTTEDNLLLFLMNTQGVADVEKHDAFITAKVKDMKIDYKKHGGSWASAPIHLNYLQSGNLLAEYKEGKYRITISNLSYQHPNASTVARDGQLQDLILNRNNEFKTGKAYLTILYYMDKHFTDVFTAKEVATSEDW